MAVARASEPVDITFQLDGTNYLATLTRGQIVHEGFHKALPADATIGHRLTFATPDGKLQAGQFVGVSLIREHRSNAAVVPEDSIIAYAGKTYLYVVANGHASRRDVVLGVRLPEVVEVTSGLKPGETIVTRGQHRLSDGVKVEQQKAPTDAAPPPPAMDGDERN